MARGEKRGAKEREKVSREKRGKKTEEGGEARRVKWKRNENKNK